MESATLPTNGNNDPVFTCMACHVAFYSADQQRTHYRSNWHKYNLKRKVVNLPSVAAETFAQRVLAQQAKEAEASKKAAFAADCKTCKKSYGSENAFNNHLNSKKHKEAEAQLLRRLQMDEDAKAEQHAIAESIAAENNRNAGNNSNAANADADAGTKSPATATAKGVVTDQRGLKVSEFHISDDDEEDEEDDEDEDAKSNDTQSQSPTSMDVDQPQSAEDKEREQWKQEKEIKKQLNQATTEEEVEKLLEKKKAAAPRLDPESDCLFCMHKSDSLESNIDHMTLAHSFFVPDLEYLVDLRGLIKYLADKLSVANVCLYCNGRGRMLQSLEAVRRHMLDKGHTKIAYDTEIDILEISDFYDFSSTYPDAHEHDADEELDPEALLQMGGRRNMPGAGNLEEEDGELILPSGSRIGHRSLQRYYKQTILPERQEKESVVIHKMLTNYTEDPEYSTQVATTSRNRAMLLAQPKGHRVWKSMAQFRDLRKQENFRTNVGIRTNRLQKHYREQNPL
ncbi:pre-60S factor rei1 [Coemansia sp. RSA 1813]|nr:pre-60S factor rei1 [Coemansia sp. RSA 1646]KAJ1770060.1 pre-60S factor rei1 [Coemansia sp. RSA 1843]KAJ2087438.1 pre-60S factor rei1 [Coemansia sp. RSA 986]KAJ2212429.1 pre-60S factor rei1 [Coemansia sp. RSA 487]KAJ2566402.1 pre-60S factor rei1 [Coemansia sp. RSA 1813]